MATTSSIAGKKQTSAPTSKGTAVKPASPRFAEVLALNGWVLAQFGVKTFDALRDELNHPKLVGMDDEGRHGFLQPLLNLTQRTPELSDEKLEEFDAAIAAVTRELNEARERSNNSKIVWQYYQYLALLFTEIYLDRYFMEPDELVNGLNKSVVTVNKRESASLTELTGAAADIANKLAFWMATGSGKTFIMHANILQYRRHMALHKRARAWKRTILITPNKSLTEQHLKEFKENGIAASEFGDSNGGGSPLEVRVLEVTRLAEKRGDRLVNVHDFAGNNLLLVDEGHRGTSGGDGGTWLQLRNALSQDSFTFEYSATFGQAVQGNSELTDTYSKAVLIDYSYRRFRGDGYGKDFRVLNLGRIADSNDDNSRHEYLTGALLSFAQQRAIFEATPVAASIFFVEAPLWVFVGTTVKGSKGSEGSDILTILQFFDRFLSNKSESVALIKKLLESGIPAADGSNLFVGQFSYLNGLQKTEEQIWELILERVFAGGAGGRLQIGRFVGKEVDGEFSLRAGLNANTFGVITVGGSSGLETKCRAAGLDVIDKPIDKGIFGDLERRTELTVLVGARKFIEGWNSYRVATMGLMNVGKTEGSQIIQLFGRGVRLRGYQKSMKRSTRLDAEPDTLPPPHLEALETLGIFGINAKYMTQFEEFLAIEGVTPSSTRKPIRIPTRQQTLLHKLKIVGLNSRFAAGPPGTAFKVDGPRFDLAVPDPNKKSHKTHLHEKAVVANFYPAISVIAGKQGPGAQVSQSLHTAKLTPAHIAFLNFDELVFDLEKARSNRWPNMTISRRAVAALLSRSDWYTLEIPPQRMSFQLAAGETIEGRFQLWMRIARSLLAKYADRYFKMQRGEWERAGLEYQELTASHSNFVIGQSGQNAEFHELRVSESEVQLIAELENLAARLAVQDYSQPVAAAPALEAFASPRHLYEPLLHLNPNLAGVDKVEVSPTPLNDGERQFIRDLDAFLTANPGFLGTQTIYVLRNRARGGGVGFFDAGDYYPDFIIWLVDGVSQRIIFADPKGLNHMDASHPKVQFSRGVKHIQKQLGDATVTLESFLVSVSERDAVKRLWNQSEAELADLNVLFQKEDKDYIRTLLTKTT